MALKKCIWLSLRMLMDVRKNVGTLCEAIISKEEHLKFEIFPKNQFFAEIRYVPYIALKFA